ncbi:Gfo/Idh/MocA family protein [Aminobacter niigataensis]|uniref:Glucose-fructose oxidoreductase n=1 Tax=Aminobacter niigataensis TaxID=83265 RepID=A0ABR6L8N6_9HYPH|nr:Gfo/Idh/MocA family oxidoreductase [Aminobacter niigataensis]MBB4653177.1 glucose-fructose oxidoreductase [Aminobacter niigataensis]CAI2933132.1 Glucose--fructose oxidoreductase [Aminobacter niigataensis]
MARWRVAGINFDHMHMGDLLREVHQHPDAEIVGIYDRQPERMAAAIANFSIPANRVFTDLDACLEATKPDLAIICAATAEHADHVERVARHKVHVLVEKPFASSLADADRMIAAMKPTGRQMAINWPLAWYPSHNTAKHLIDDGAIGEVIEVHYYDGNRGPLYHLADKVEVTPEEVEAAKSQSWWYKKASGGGSLRDYLGYGVTLATWFRNGDKPVEVTSVVDQVPGIEVDQHSITVCRYASGLSRFETRWGTFTDPWTLQPQPKCGFVIVGRDGTISSYDYEPHVTVQTRTRPEAHQIPVDVLPVGRRAPIEYVLDCLAKDQPISGPLSPTLSRIGQQITDSAALSAELKRTVELLP